MITFEMTVRNDQDRTYTATMNGYSFSFVAQYWNENGDFKGASDCVWVAHGGMKAAEDPALQFTESAAWTDFEKCAGITAEQLREQFESHFTNL